MANENFNQSVGVVFEGISGSTSNLNGLCYYYGQEPATKSFEYTKKLSRIPGSISTAADPYDSSMKSSAFTFDITFDDESCEQILKDQISPNYSLTASMNGTETTVGIQGVGGFIPSGSIVHIGDEALEIQSTATSNYTVRRGILQTSATPHSEDAGVFVLRGLRRFSSSQLVLNDGSGDQTYWRGLVEGISTTKDGTKISVNTKEIFNVIRGAKIVRGGATRINGNTANNSQIINLNSDRTWEYTQTRIANGVSVSWNNSDEFLANYKLRYRKQNEQSGVEAPHFQVNDQLVISSYNTTTNTISSFFPKKSWDSSLGDIEINGIAKPISDPVYEVFTIDVNEINSTITEALDYPYHPVAITMAILTSTYSPDNNVGAEAWDCLHGDLGLGLPLALFDTTNISDLIEKTKEIKIERLILGWDGEREDAWQIIVEKLLKPYGFFVGTTTTGLLTISRMEFIDIGQWSNAVDNNKITALPDLLEFEAAQANSFNALEVEVGSLPWKKGQKSFVDIREAGVRRDVVRTGIFGDERKTSIDFSVVSENKKALPYILKKVRDGIFNIPRFSFKVKDSQISGADLSIGSRVIISNIDVLDPWMPDGNGLRVALDGTTDFIKFSGQIIERKFNIESRTYEITVLLLNYRIDQFARYRAPAGIVEAYGVEGETATLRISPNVFHTENTDASFFTAGDEIQIYSTTGEQISTQDRTISSISSNDFILDAPFTIAPTAGQIVRLADRPSYSNQFVINPETGAAFGLNFTIPYTYFCRNNQSSRTLDTFASGDTCDIYGG